MGNHMFRLDRSGSLTSFRQYDLWYPIPTDRYGSARASPSFVGYLFVTEAVGSSTQSRLALLPSPPELPNLAAYAIWDPVVRAVHDGPARLALLNLAVRNVSQSQDAGEVQVDISAWTRGGQAKVKRLTAPGLDSTDSDTATWAGQSYTNGTASSEELIEQPEGGKVTVKGSEAVLVFF